MTYLSRGVLPENLRRRSSLRSLQHNWRSGTWIDHEVEGKWWNYPLSQITSINPFVSKTNMESLLLLHTLEWQYTVTLTHIRRHSASNNDHFMRAPYIEYFHSGVDLVSAKFWKLHLFLSIWVKSINTTWDQNIYCNIQSDPYIEYFNSGVDFCQFLELCPPDTSANPNYEHF